MSMIKPFPRWASNLLAALVVAALCVALGAALAGCVSTVNDRTGTVETDLLGILPLYDEAAAPPAHPLDVPPWEQEGWAMLPEDDQVKAVWAWNAEHGWVSDREPVVPRSGSVGLLVGAALAIWKAYEALGTGRGRANAAVVVAPRTPALTRLASTAAILIGRDSPPEAKALMAQAADKRAKRKAHTPKPAPEPAA